MLFGIHKSLALVAEEFALDHSEAADLAKAYTDLAEHYPALVLPAKASAIVNFGQAVTAIYGSRLFAFRLRMRMERNQSRAPTPTRAAQPVQQPAGATPGPNGPVTLQPEPGAPPDMNGAPQGDVPSDIRTGEIPGVGHIEFPPDHPLFKRAQTH